MKLPSSIPGRSAKAGGALSIVLIILAILTAALAATLQLTDQQNTLSSRAESWEGAFHLAEAGVEEAMSHINQNQAAGLASQGWTLEGTNFTKSRSFAQGTYAVTIYPSTPPIIHSVGSCRMPRSSGFLSREIDVTTTNKSFGPQKAITMRGNIDTSSGSLQVVDSFDSNDPVHSTSGRYDSTKHKDNGDVEVGPGCSVTLKNGDRVYGHVYTGPSGEVKREGDAEVGDDYHNSTTTHTSSDDCMPGVQVGHFRDDAHTVLPDVCVPNGTWTVIGNCKASLSDGNYRVESSVLVGDTEQITVCGHTALHITGDLEVAQTGKIVVNPGACLTLYCDGSSAKLNGGCIDNQTGKASSCAVKCTPNCTAVTLDPDSGSFVGTIYAPSAQVDLSEANHPCEVSGGIVGNNAKVNGPCKIHYDESLNGIGPTPCPTPCPMVIKCIKEH